MDSSTRATLEILMPVFSDSVFPSWFDKSLLTDEANDEILIPVSPVSLLLVSLSFSLILFCSVTDPTLDSEAIDEIFRPKSAEALSHPSSISLLFSVVTEEICRSWLLS